MFKMRTLLEQVWADWRMGFLGSAGIAMMMGLLSAWLTPRGPITSFEALLSICFALLLGLMGGLLMTSRWRFLIIPAVFVITFELARFGIKGPTVDTIHLNSTYGMIAFVVGRLFHGLLVLFPMILGLVYGGQIAGQLGRETGPALNGFGWGLTGLASLGVIALAFFISRPPTTAPILTPEGGEDNSIAELTAIPIGGHKQAVMIRGRDVDNPVLLYLAGGPGGTDLGAMRADVGLEQHFVVVTWDQRGAGKSYSALDPVDTLTLEQMIADTVEVTNYLRKRFEEDKIYLVGNSWGTLLGALAVEEHPELYHAFVGTGQMVSPRETDIMFYEDTLAWAEETGNEALVKTLRDQGPPPYEDLLAYEPAISHEHDWNPYPGLDPSKELPFNLFVPENTFMDRVNGMRGFLDTFSILYPQLQEIDFRTDLPALQVPYYLVIGKYEARGRDVLAREWFEILEAPAKEMIVFEGSGHRPPFEEPAEFASLMARVLEATCPSDQE
jgi:pimeloyl-ACP methyl ester carboxylesterase